MTGLEDIAGVERHVSGDVAEMRRLLTMALLLRADGGLRHALVRDLRADSFAVGQGAAWLNAREDGVEMVRRRPPGASAIPFEMLVSDARLGDLRRSRGWLVCDQVAGRMLGHVLDGRRMADAAAAGDILEWAPLLERTAYRLSARLIVMLDALRAILRQRMPSRGREAAAIRRRYWGLVVTMARLTLLATTTGASTWLAPMAHSFEWLNWTPSLPLGRERSLWLSAVSARAAAEFGPEVVSSYGAMLRRCRHTGGQLDCLIGLTAIALRHEAAVSEVTEILEVHRVAADRIGSYRSDHLMLGLKQASALLQQRGDQMVESSISVSFSPAIATADAAGIVSQGFAALKAVPAAISASPVAFMPPSALAAPDLVLGTTDNDLWTMFARAWSHDPDGTSVH